MERLHTLDAFVTKHQIATQTHSLPFPCTEQVIIDLQALFMIPGIYRIEIEIVEKGRALLEALLVSLNCYSSIACITANPTSFTENIYDCTSELAVQPCIETFFTEQLFFDCMLIELSPRLTTYSWYKRAERYFYTTTVSLHAPIIFIEYK